MRLLNKKQKAFVAFGIFLIWLIYGAFTAWCFDISFVEGLMKLTKVCVIVGMLATSIYAYMWTYEKLGD